MITDWRELKVGDIIQDIDDKGILLITKVETIKRVHYYNPFSEAEGVEEKEIDKPMYARGVDTITEDGYFCYNEFKIREYKKIDINQAKEIASTKAYSRLIKKIKRIQ